MQKTVVIGYTGGEALVNNLDNGRKVINFSVASTKSYKDKDGVKQEKTTWFSCSKFVREGGSTEVAKYLLKGTLVHVEGEEEPTIYESKEGPKIDRKLTVKELNLLSSNGSK